MVSVRAHLHIGWARRQCGTALNEANLDVPGYACLDLKRATHPMGAPPACSRTHHLGHRGIGQITCAAATGELTRCLLPGLPRSGLRLVRGGRGARSYITWQTAAVAVVAHPTRLLLRANRRLGTNPATRPDLPAGLGVVSSTACRGRPRSGWTPQHLASEPTSDSEGHVPRLGLESSRCQGDLQRQSLPSSSCGT